MNITLTREKALEIQQRHIAHYLHLNPDLPRLVAERTTADQLDSGVEYPVTTINRHIPRGGAIEALCGLDVNRFKD